MKEFFAETQLSNSIIMFRFFLSFFLGSCIGWERASKRQVAGLRTHMLICMGSTSLMLLSIWVPQVIMRGVGDPSRIAAQVVSGIGFLGGGAILKIGTNVRGLTTAASIWVASALGLLIGAGMYIPALILTGLTLFTLSIMGLWEHKIFPIQQNRTLELSFKGELPNLLKITELLSTFDILVISSEIKKERGFAQNSKYVLYVSTPIKLNVKKLIKVLSARYSLAKIDFI